MGADVVHVVWSPATGPLAAYWVSARADEHARTMLGVDVTACELHTGGELAPVIYVVWSPIAGPMAAYWRVGLALANAAARGNLRISDCLLRARLPDETREDIYFAEMEGFDDGNTPVDRPSLKKRSTKG